jgi:hypothetical protein
MEKEDKINHPHHYNQGIECADYVESHNMCFFQGNAIKYITRFKYKGTPVEDLKKAVWYINRLIERIENLQKEREQNESRRHDNLSGSASASSRVELKNCIPKIS